MHVLWICQQVTPHSKTVVVRCMTFWQIWMRPHGWWVGFPDCPAVPQITVSSVKLGWIASCFVEYDPPSYTDILFASEMYLYFDTIKCLCFLCYGWNQMEGWHWLIESCVEGNVLTLKIDQHLPDSRVIVSNLCNKLDFAWLLVAEISYRSLSQQQTYRGTGCSCGGVYAAGA